MEAADVANLNGLKANATTDLEDFKLLAAGLRAQDKRIGGSLDEDNAVLGKVTNFDGNFSLI